MPLATESSMGNLGHVTAAQVAANSAAQAKQTATENATVQADLPTLISDINSNNFAGAWKLAESTAPQFGTNTGAVTTDPLLAAMESSKGLQTIDPTKQWTPAEVQQYYAALGNSAGYTNGNLLGQNPYGLWGSQGAVLGGSDASANIAQEGSTPDVSRFAGARPSKNFVEKYGADIALLVAAVAAPEVIGALAPELSAGAAIATGGATGAATGLIGTAAAGALYGAGTGALVGEISGGNVGKDALLGAVGGGITGAVAGSTLQGNLANEIGSPAASAVTKLGTAELTKTADSAITSPTGGSVSTPNPVPQTMSNDLGNVTATPATSASPSIGSSLLSGLGASSLGSLVGNVAPYAAVGALGISQANKGQAQDQQYAAQEQALGQPMVNQSATLANNYNTNTLNPQDTALLQNAQSLATQINQNSQGLSTIAQQAFSNYSNGTLPPADQAALDAQVTSQKQQVAQQLASAGITDSTILASANANIDNQALITKQNLLNAQFATGNQAYDSYLTGTQAGQSILTTATQTADTTLQGELSASISSFGAGANVIMAGINTAMTTDAAYSAQVSQLMGTLAAAYAKQYMTANPTGAGSPLSALTGGAGNPAANLSTTGPVAGSPISSSTTALSNAGTDAASLNADMASLGTQTMTTAQLDSALSGANLASDLGSTAPSSLTTDFSSLLGGP